MSANTPSRIGAHLPHDGVSRRGLLLLGGLGVTGLWGARAATSTLAQAHPRAAQPTLDAGLPPAPPPPPAGTRAREPFSSGAIGPWQTSTHQASTTEEDRRAAQHDDGVHLLGDSIGSRLLPVLRDRLAGRPLSYDVWNGRPTAPALDRLERAADEDRLAPTVLAVLGSNDVFDPWPFAAQLDRARQIVGDRRLLWVTPYVSRPGSPAADLRNSALLEIALERAATAGTVELVRWFEYLARAGEGIEGLVEDGVHPSPTGAAALADLVLTRLG